MKSTVRWIVLFTLILLLIPATGAREVRAGGGIPFWLDIAWSPDGSLLAAVGNRGGLTLFTPDLSQFAIVSEAYSNALAKLAWSSDGARLAVKQYYDRRYVLSLWSTMPLEMINRLEIGNTGQALEIAWQQDGRALFLEIDGSLQHLNPLTLAHSPIALTLPFEPNYDTLQYLSFNRDSTQLAYIVMDDSRRTMRLYAIDLTTGDTAWEVNLDHLLTRTAPNPISGLAWSSDGRVAIRGHLLAIYAPVDDTLQILTPFAQTGIRNIEWSPDGRYLAVIAGKTVEIWDTATGERVEVTYSNEKPDQMYDPHTLAWHPDGDMLAVSLTFDAEILAFDMSHLYQDP